MFSQLGKKTFLWIALAIAVFAAAGVLYLINENRRAADYGPSSEAFENNAATWRINAVDTDINETIESLLAEIIQKAPKESSNPYDYVKDSEAFEKLVQLGKPALDYMFKSFTKSYEDGLREYIMACACAKIMSIYNDETGIGTNSGREWLDKYSELQGMDNFLQVDADYARYVLTKDEKLGDMYKSLYPDDVDKTNMDDVISDYILRVNRDAYPVGEKGIEAHKVLGSELKWGVTYLYLQVGFRWFGFENGIFTPVSGGGDVVMMQLVKSITGEYMVAGYKCAMGGGMWEKSIRDMFPRDLAETVIRDNAAIGKELWNIQVDKARAYLKKISKGDAPIEPAAKKNKESEGAQRAINVVTLIRSSFPNWVGTREVLYWVSGGPNQGFNVRCMLETKCESAQDGSYNVTLMRNWGISINGKITMNMWKYNVSGDKIKLVESEDNESSIYTIK